MSVLNPTPPANITQTPSAVVPDATGSELNIDSPAMRTAALSPLSGTGIFNYIKSLSLVAITMTDTYTTAVANTDYKTVTDGFVFFRPNFESHTFFDTHWIFNITTGNPGPTQPLSINLQTWLNQYHILISPTGFANDWTITLPTIGANQTWTFTQSFRGGIFNLELRRAPAFHMVEFKYQISSIPSGWSQVQMKPRLTLMQSIPSSQIQFQAI